MLPLLIAECGFRLAVWKWIADREALNFLQSAIRNPHAQSTSPTRRATFVDELDDAHGDGAEQEDVYEAFLAQHEFSHEPRGEERRGEQTDVQVM